MYEIIMVVFQAIEFYPVNCFKLHCVKMFYINSIYIIYKKFCGNFIVILSIFLCTVLRHYFHKYCIPINISISNYVKINSCSFTVKINYEINMNCSSYYQIQFKIYIKFKIVHISILQNNFKAFRQRKSIIKLMQIM